MKVVSISLKELQNYTSLLINAGQEEFNAALVQIDEETFALSTMLYDGKLVPKDPDVIQEPKVAGDPVDIYKGCTPVWRDSEGRFSTKAEDADGKPEYVLENCTSSMLNSIAKSLGINIGDLAKKAAIELIELAIAEEEFMRLDDSEDDGSEESHEGDDVGGESEEGSGDEETSNEEESQEGDDANAGDE